MARLLRRANPLPPSADAGLRGLKTNGDQSERIRSAIPAREFSSDERAERARGGAIAFLVIVAAAAGLTVMAVAAWLLL